MKSVLLRSVAVLASAFIGYVALEIGYRWYSYEKIKNTALAATLRQIPIGGGGNSIFDVHTGYRYRPNIEVRSAGNFPISWRTNSHGHIARGDYPVAKPPGELRIGLVGDSFTANVTNTIRWGDVLEDRLNFSADWSAIASGRRTRVINFGLDGIGVVQFDDVAERMVLPFDVDLLIVNLLRSDVARTPYYRGERIEQDAQQVADYITRELLPKMPW